MTLKNKNQNLEIFYFMPIVIQLMWTVFFSISDELQDISAEIEASLA